MEKAETKCTLVPQAALLPNLGAWALGRLDHHELWGLGMWSARSEIALQRVAMDDVSSWATRSKHHPLVGRVAACTQKSTIILPTTSSLQLLVIVAIPASGLVF